MNSLIRILRRWRWPLALLILCAALLLLDLQARGLVWRFVWSQTGEESLLGQARGMVELGGNLLRAQPVTDPLAPIQHADAPPFGINVFLQKEVEEPKLRAMLEMIRAAGFVWLRQEFPWEDIEVDGRGQFTDSRNDYSGDGVPDTIDAWAKYDRIVDLAQEYDLRLLVRLSNPPRWSRAENPDTAGGALAPPDDFQDFVNFAAAVAERYRGRITHYQIWNEPNIYPEWGENFADPAAYTRLLCMTHDALKAIDPRIVVLSAAIAPTISLDGYLGYQDILYLHNMYAAGAGDCFDVLSAQGYGLFSGPTDRRLRTTTVNFQRHVYYRHIMVANGDAHKPIWISEAAWNPVLDAPLPADQIADFNRFGAVTLDQAARYMPAAYERAAQEWPWIGQISYWFFTRPDPSEMNQSFFYFRMVEPDYSPERPTFTPLPVYDAMRDYIAEQRANPVLYRGTHQGEHWAVQRDSQAFAVDSRGAQFGRALRAVRVTFNAYGTDLTLRLRTDRATLRVLVNGETLVFVQPSPDWQEVQIARSSMAQPWEVEITGLRAFFHFDSVTVDDRTWGNLGPPLLIAALLALFAGWQIISALRLRFRRRVA